MLSKDSFLNIDISKLKDHVILCLDNEGDKTFKDLVIAKTANRLITAGKTVSIAMPIKVGNNFNDLLKEAGTQSVARQLASAVDAKILLKSEIKTIKSMERTQAQEDDLKKLHKIYEQFSKSTVINKKQENYLKTIEMHEKQYFDKSVDLYKSLIKDRAAHSVKTGIEKEIER